MEMLGQCCGMLGMLMALEVGVVNYERYIKQ